MSVRELILRMLHSVMLLIAIVHKSIVDFISITVDYRTAVGTTPDNRKQLLD